MADEDSKFSAKQLKEFRLAYGIYDEDGDGKLDSDACCKCLRACGIPLTENAIANITTDLDIYSDGEVNWDGFMALMEEHHKPLPTEKELIAAFKAMDEDGSGAVSRSELKRFLTNVGEKLSEDEFEQMVADIDTDGDGEIDYKEFASLMAKSSSYSDF
ncbi:uncharacterized protein MONBRDRAFT_24630 [Monosiga brevicollis MX1]|uniref:EF-hand domain-containing protein n=1 Tax=Monosiga brevicollis TaxID=81824 RepID=A9UX06_MONBE|nr:uncharacterized protein MONBRDRAFT_24630 [Monosiga brevicollis MX1]EDQ90131.1 predicted protein [Monosiga brevicollis MX1]|eukprot:XP_001744898.1 hypothetical protein [Monosiga brevicollis MX1]